MLSIKTSMITRRIAIGRSREWLCRTLVSVVGVMVLLATAVAPAQQAKNVILMIGDGMGFNSDLAGSYYRFGEANSQRYHRFSKHLGCSTFAIKRADYTPDKAIGYSPDIYWSDLAGNSRGTDFTEVTDSAAAATAINSGVKTLNGRIGTDFMAVSLKLFGQMMAENGRSVGIVTTVTLSHATPAAVMAHVAFRDDYAPITREMLLDQPVSVIMGGGHPDFFAAKPIEKKDYKFVGGKYVWNELKQNRGFADAVFIDTKEQFESLAQSTPDSDNRPPAKVMGVPKSNYIAPVDGAVDEKSQKLLETIYSPEEVRELPSLTTMSIAALNVLAQNPKGFYIMIEGGAIDAANHGRDMDKMVLEHTGFSKAIEAVCDWVEKYSSWDETLFIITADHETGDIWGPGTYDDTNGNGIYDAGEPFSGFQPLVNNGQGEKPGVQYASGSHSNALVPVWINGAGANLIDPMIRDNDSRAATAWNFSGDYIDNTDITPFMIKATGITPKK